MQPLAGEDMSFDALDDRIQHKAGGAYLIGQGRQADRHALSRVPLGLEVQWLMLPILLEQDHGQQAGPCPASRGDMERRRRLADPLAVAARELLADVLN